METTHTGNDEERLADDRGREFIDVERRFPATGSGFMVAPVLWFGYFVAVYALQGAGCAIGLDDAQLFGVSALTLSLLGLTAAAVLAMLLVGAWSFRSWHRLREPIGERQRQAYRPASFLAFGALLHAGLFLVAVLWTGVPILLLESCGATGAG